MTRPIIWCAACLVYAVLFALFTLWCECGPTGQHYDWQVWP